MRSRHAAPLRGQGWRSWRGFLALPLLLPLLAGACGVFEDDQASSGGGAGNAVVAGLQVPDDLGEACGAAAATPLDDLRVDRAVARCGPGAPAPQPLDRQVTLRVAILEPSERMAALLLADQLGELERENLAVELVEVPRLGDAYEALAADEVDVVAGDLHAAFFDLVEQGDGARLALGGPIPSAAGHNDVDQAGLWVARDVVDMSDRWVDLEGEQVLVPDGIRGASVYPLMQLLAQGDASLNDFAVRPASSQEAAEQLLGGHVTMAWVEDPYWQPLADEGGFELATTRPREALGGMVLHERLLDEDADREVGLVFVRAIIRTINTYLADDYREDEDVLAALTEATGWTAEQLEATPPLVFDWEVRRGTVERIYGMMVPLGSGLAERPIEVGQAEDVFLDRSLYEEAVQESG